jgi:GTP-binding protein HflX
VGLRGPGETQLETDRRDIGRRISTLKRELEGVRAHRARYRARRQRAGILVVALVGYTNAGKSTLLNALSGADVLIADQLFATLDPTTRRVSIAGGGEMLFTDTVGFIQKLPTTLAAAFRATLEEIADADVLLHVIDASHPHALEQADTVDDVLAELEVERLPLLVVFNKCDLPAARPRIDALRRVYSAGIGISALQEEGLAELLEAVGARIEERLVPSEVFLPYADGRLVALYHEVGQIDTELHGEEGVHIKGRLPSRYVSQFLPYVHPDSDAQPDEDEQSG